MDVPDDDDGLPEPRVDEHEVGLSWPCAASASPPEGAAAACPREAKRWRGSPAGGGARPRGAGCRWRGGSGGEQHVVGRRLEEAGG